jgi:hypothetical protein
LAFIAVAIFVVTEEGGGYGWIYWSYSEGIVGYLEHGASQWGSVMA